DPAGREQRLACGAALFNLRLALHGLGVRPLVTLHAEKDQPDLLASVRFGGRRAPTPLQQRLLAAVPRRHTNRLPFSEEPVTTGERAALRKAAVEEGAWLHMVEGLRERSALARLTAEAHTTQRADPAYVAEAARWTAVTEGRADGVPARGGDYRPGAHERWVMRDFTGGRGRSNTSAGVPFEREPAIAVLASYGIGLSADVTAGQAMQRVLLTATVEGLTASFLSQLIEVERAREALRRLIGGPRGPQVVLRIGRGWPVPATPRRPVGDCVLPALSETV
ncbi:MAG: nitroreductase family protein, partial [Pseudonocardia sp.]|nr:nitroreductase family protein [Pseudonocardia sp.]